MQGFLGVVLERCLSDLDFWWFSHSGESSHWKCRSLASHDMLDISGTVLFCGLGKTMELFPLAAPTAKAYPLEAHNAAVEVWQAKIPKPAAERSGLKS